MVKIVPKFCDKYIGTIRTYRLAQHFVVSSVNGGMERYGLISTKFIIRLEANAVQQ